MQGQKTKYKEKGKKIRNGHYTVTAAIKYHTYLSKSSGLHSTCIQCHRHSGSQGLLSHASQCTCDHSHHYLSHWPLCMDWALKINDLIYPFQQYIKSLFTYNRTKKVNTKLNTVGMNLCTACPLQEEHDHITVVRDS